MRHLFFTLILTGLALLARPALAEDVWLLLSGESGIPQQTWADRLREALPSGTSLGVLRLGDAPLNQQCPGARLVLVEGAEAAAAALRGCPQARLWVFSLPALSLEALQKQDPQRVSGLSSDVPPARQVAVLAALRPRPQVVALPYSAASEPQARVMERALRIGGFRAVLLPTDPASQPLRPLREVLGEVQAVLALPDPALYHAGLLKHWLLMTAREGVPMIGGQGLQDVRHGVSAAAVQPADAMLAAALRQLPELLARGPLPAALVDEVAEMVHNPLMLERLGLRLEDGR